MAVFQLVQLFFLHIFGSLSPKIIVVLADNHYLGRFKAKICLNNAIVLEFGKDPHFYERKTFLKVHFLDKNPA